MKIIKKTPLNLAVSISLFMMGQTYAGDINNDLPAITDAVTFSQGGNELARVTGEGSVGIGTTTPSEKLHIDGGKIRLVDATSTEQDVTIEGE